MMEAKAILIWYEWSLLIGFGNNTEVKYWFSLSRSDQSVSWHLTSQWDSGHFAFNSKLLTKHFLNNYCRLLLVTDWHVVFTKTHRKASYCCFSCLLPIDANVLLFVQSGRPKGDFTPLMEVFFLFRVLDWFGNRTSSTHTCPEIIRERSPWTVRN